MQSIKITRNNGSNMELDLIALMKVLRNPDYADYPIALYSISGPYRTGKSFLQNLLIHYIQNFQHSDEETEFFSKTIDDIFKWRSGLEACTEGIVILSKPFILNKSGMDHEVALFLMDTQGLYDNETSTKNAKMMGILNFLMSSLQFFNVKEQIESHHLEHIYQFVEFSRKVNQEDPSCSPNQINSLLFIIRDWENEDEIPFGLHKDKSYFETVFNSNLSRSQENEMMKDYLSHFFGVIPGAFFPHPSLAVKKKPCSLSALEKEFQEGIIQLCDHLFSPENIVIKQINGEQVTCSELFAYIESISPLLQQKLEGNVSSFIEADMNAQLNNLVMECATNYFADVEKQCIKSQIKEHRKVLLNDLTSKTLERFDKAPKRGGNLILEWRNELINLLKQCDVAIEACKDAEEKYLEALKEFDCWITEKSESSTSISEFSNEAAISKRNELVEAFRESVSKEIADQCAEHLENNANLILTKTNEEVQQFFRKLRNQKILQISLGTLLIFGGVGMMVAGLIILPLLSDVSVYVLEFGVGTLFSNSESTYVRSRNTMSFPKNQNELQKYKSKNLTLSLNLSFGKVFYPLRSKVQSN